jgi:hypothetical protein
MRCRYNLTALIAGMTIGILCLCSVPSSADEPPKSAEPGTLVVIDAAGKEQTLKTWKFANGTRRLSWLAPAKEDIKKDGKEKDKPKEPVDKKDKSPVGPEALEFREEHSTQFENGVLTLVLLDRIRSLDYEDKDVVSARVATSDKTDDDVTLKGLTKYKGINKLSIEAEVDKGELGVAEIKFLGGVPKGIRGLRFAPPKTPAAAPAGRSALVTIADRDEKEAQKVSDLRPLYKLGNGSERLAPTLFFKKTLKIDVAKIQKIRVVEDSDGAEFSVTLKDGSESTLTLLRDATLDGKQARLQGMVGRVPAGYKLFPLHAVKEIQFDEAKEESKPKDGDK